MTGGWYDRDDDRDRPSTASPEPLFTKRTYKRGRSALHGVAIIFATAYGLLLIPEGLILAVPVLYMAVLYHYMPFRAWLLNRRALKQYRAELNSEDPLAELNQK